MSVVDICACKKVENDLNYPFLLDYLASFAHDPPKPLELKVGICICWSESHSNGFLGPRSNLVNLIRVALKCGSSFSSAA